MSLALPVLFHWSPADRREKIIARGLRSSTPTLVETFSDKATGKRRLLASVGTETRKAVCLGTTPSHAWSLCGAIWGQRGETWDLWQVTLHTDDMAVTMPSDIGYRLGEIRVLNNIPKGRVWHVGSRTIGARKWSHE